MSHGITFLHSHSGLERDLRFPKHIVLVDDKYKYMFDGETCVPFRHNGVDYIKVSTLSFANKGGVFKNLLS
jgi:hypothetical protein